MGMIKYTTGQGIIAQQPIFSSIGGEVNNEVLSHDNGEGIVTADAVSPTTTELDTATNLTELLVAAHPLANISSDESGDAPQQQQDDQSSNDLPPLHNRILEMYQAGHRCNSEGEYPFLSTQPGQYNKEIAQQLSAVSGWSYSDVETFQEKLSDEPKTSFTNADFVQLSVRNDAMFIVATAQIIRTRDKKVIIVCFRGTEVTNLINWATDATTRKIDWKGLSVHSGFLLNWESVWYGPKGVLAHLLAPIMLQQHYDYDSPQHLSTIENSATNEQDCLEAIYITGHSLGGAMAMLGGFDLQHSKTSMVWDKLRGIYTYGQPMVISRSDERTGQDRIGSRLFRHVYYNDIIPHLPPVTTGSFVHVGREFRYFPPTLFGPHSGVWIESKEKTTQIWVALLAAPFALADGVVDSYPFLSFVKFSWSLLDHNPYRYMDSLYGEGRVSERGVQVVLNSLLHQSLQEDKGESDLVVAKKLF